MIRVPPVPRPDAFADVEARGNAWLNEHPDTDPHMNPLWKDSHADLRAGFQRRCGFLAMFITRGTVDHFESIRNARHRSYDWSNLRYVDFGLNSAKKPAWDGKLLDPYEVEDRWFEILLPSLQLVVSKTMPPEFRARADFTLKKFRLTDGEDVIELRRGWLDMYEQKKLDLAGLCDMAPLLARAVAERDGLEFPDRAGTTV